MTEVAILGYGVVGSGTVEVLEKNAVGISKNAGQRVNVKKILEIRDFPDSPHKEKFTKSFEEIEKDDDITVVAEVIGGVDAALDYTRRALKAGKSVVTSNKELVATHGYELLKLAAENGVNYLFEASVGGGIPVVRPIVQCIAGNKINEIYGILNGTTNYILSEMESKGLEFETTLGDAQKKGYAEADPTADIDGFDACRKICILSSLAFGRHIYPEQVPTEGIKSITPEDIRYAADLGYKIKLLGRSRVIGDKVSVYVQPHLVSFENMLSHVDGVMNGVVIRGNAVGDVMFYGAGAGKLPTASAVTADIIDAVKHRYARKLIGWGEGGDDFTEDPVKLETAWYVRTDAKPSMVEREFGSVLFVPNNQGNTIAFKTGSMNGKIIKDLLNRGITALTLFRVLGDY
jgi:homoserine dehydrogenase